jgi:hypothetical protein
MRDNQTLQVIKGYTEWVQDYMDRGWKVYFLTFKFRELGRHKQATVFTMQTEVRRFYSTLLTRVNRWPKRESQRHRLPVLIGAPDSPVFKHHSTSTVVELSRNQGVHFHAILTIPRKSRLKTRLRKHIKKNEPKYLGYHGKLIGIHVRRVKQLEGRVVDYLFKHIKRDTFTLDDVLILPEIDQAPVARLQPSAAAGG